MATRCCWPPERDSARCPASAVMSNCSSAEMAIALSSGAQSLRSERTWLVWFRRPMSTLFMTSRRPTMLNCWNTIAQRMRQSRRSAPLSVVTSRPFQAMLPSDTSRSRLTIRSSVDLPAPDRPITPTKLPGTIARLTSSTAVLEPKRRETPLISSMRNSLSPQAARDVMRQWDDNHAPSRRLCTRTSL